MGTYDITPQIVVQTGKAPDVVKKKTTTDIKAAPGRSGTRTTTTTTVTVTSPSTTPVTVRQTASQTPKPTPVETNAARLARISQAAAGQLAQQHANDIQAAIKAQESRDQAEARERATAAALEPYARQAETDFYARNTRLGDGTYIDTKTFKALPESQQKIARERGLDALRRMTAGAPLALVDLENKYKFEAASQQAALDRLKPFTVSSQPIQRNPVTGQVRGGTAYDVAKFLRLGGDVKTLKTAGYSSDTIKEAEQFNRENYGTGLKPDGKNTPTVSREQFMENLVIDEVGTGEIPGIHEPDRDKKLAIIQKAQDRASAKYRDLYGSKNVTLSNVGAVGEFLAAPVFRAVRPEVSIKNITPVEWALTGMMVVTAAVPAVRGVSAGVRAGKTTGQAIKSVALAEAKASVISAVTLPDLDAPVKFGKITGWADIAETTVRPGKVPIEALEIRESTVRLPVSRSGLSGKGAKKLQDTVTTRVIKNDIPEATIKGTHVELTKTALNKTSPAVVHASPDVRPFLDGVKITPGREGGLFVAPSLHSRFTKSSAFGDIPEGGLPGGLIIRDEQVLAKLKSSDKLYKGMAEVEKVIPGGVDLPKPSQILITRDMQGNRITLLVFGKKFSQREIAQMKFIGAVDTVKQIFQPAIKISKSEMDDLVRAKNEIKTLETDLVKAKKGGNKARVKEIIGRLDDARADARRLVQRVEDYTPGRANPVLINTGKTYLLRTRSGKVGRAERNSYIIGYTGDMERSRNDTSQRSDSRTTTERTGADVTRAYPERTETRNDTRTDRDETGRADDGRTDARTVVDTRGPDRNDPPRVVPPPVPPVRTTIDTPPRTPDRTPITNKAPGKGELKSIKLETELKERHSKADYAAAVTWKQGIGYWTVFPDKSIEFSMDKPDGVKLVAGPDANKPAATIQVRNAKPGAKVTTFDADMGIQDIKVWKQSGKILDIRFKQDRKQRTTNRVNLKLHSEKRGKIYYTNVSGGQVMSRRPL